ncbi:hypothetical protein JD844_034314 [Phrynosoma platyrhinos]|uniref:Fucosyltransferase n=1 Tax=Phrynosoma platyrhinos TaxID=52577 RepID=A0ABQ7T878_PHRPL|nr:hypothetical protein JD844_034314 [Phrynosoma platyrhinos]
MDSNGQTPSITWKKFLAFIAFQLGFIAILFAYVQMSMKIDPGGYDSVTLADPVDKDNSFNFTLLLWTCPFGKFCRIENCSRLLGIHNCHITVERSWYSKADAILVHHREVHRNPKKLPKEPRPPSQRWIWANMESPTNSPNLDFMDNLFNFTMTYRRDSDIFTPYGWMEVLPQPQNFTIPPKSKLVAWVVSSWQSGSSRVKYYKELRKYIQVDVYGRHHSPLPWVEHLSTLSQYKFYLAFENSIHEDYITEKIWRNAFLTWTVPVVLGPPRKNYERYIPSDSFIHVDDFPSAQELAMFLHELDGDTLRYQSYFRWRSWLKPVRGMWWAMNFCKACQVLQKKPIQFQTIPELSKWFKGGGNVTG